MRQWLRRLFHPAGPVLAALAIVSTGLLIVSLGGYTDNGVIIYGSYLLSSYALVAVCLWMPTVVTAARGRVRQRAAEITSRSERLSELSGRYSDDEARNRVALYLSLASNMLYAGFKLGASVWYRSLWLGAIGMYYAVLSLLRFILLRGARRMSRLDEHRAYRRTALAMLVLTVCMGAIITQTVIENRSYDYAGVLIYAFALYAFTRIVSASVTLVKHWRTESEVLAASRCLSLACAMMSIMALQTALLNRFGEDIAFRRTANSLTGLAITLIMLAMSGAMLMRGRKTNDQTGMNGKRMG